MDMILFLRARVCLPVFSPVSIILILTTDYCDVHLQAGRYCKTKLNPPLTPKDSAVGVSRLAISKLYRRRSGDGLYGATNAAVDDGSVQGHRRRPEIVLGLYKAMYRESKWLGVVNWYVVREN